jgi:hypothetical protein
LENFFFISRDHAKLFAFNRDISSTGKAPTQASLQSHERSREQGIEIVVRDALGLWTCSKLPMQLSCPLLEISFGVIVSMDFLACNYFIFSPLGDLAQQAIPQRPLAQTPALAIHDTLPAPELRTR